MHKPYSLYIKKLLTSLKRLRKWIGQQVTKCWRKNWWHKVIVLFGIIFLILLGTTYGIARWYIYTESKQPLSLGVSFIPDYAESLGLNPESTMQALINQLHIKYFRLTSYWSDIETSPGQFDYSQLDWEFQTAEAAHAKITLSLGLRQPRWPECHVPSWAENEPTDIWEPQLNQFIANVINRYKNSSSLAGYQLENEYFLKGFGECTNFDRSRLINEFNLVKKIDPVHPIIIARSNNLLGWPIGQPTPDEYAISIYKRVWDTHTHRYFEYPIPAWFYAFLAGIQKITTGRDMIIHELQAEAWPPRGQTIPETSLSEQNKSMNAAILKSRIQYGEATGMRTIYLWGSEYWYYRLVNLHDPSLWNVARQVYAQANQ